MTAIPGIRLLQPLLLAIVVAAADLAGLTRSIELDPGLRLLHLLRGPETPPAGIVIVALDGAGVARLATSASRLAEQEPALAACLPAGLAPRLAAMRSPEDLPRELYACLIDALAGAGARAIAFDVHFAAVGDATGDAALASAIRRGPPTVLLERVLPGPGAGWLMREPPSAPLREVAAGVGFFLLEDDGRLKERYLARIPEAPDALPMPEAALRAIARTASVAAAEPSGPSWRLLRYYGPPRSFPTIGFTALLAGDPAARAAIEGAVVFVGAARVDEEASVGATDARDRYLTPFDNAGDQMYGVELAATALANEMQGRVLRRLPAPAEGALVLALSFACFAAATRKGGLRALVAAPAIAALATAGAVAAFSAGLWLPVATLALVVTPIALLIGAVAGYRRLSRGMARVLPMQLMPHDLDLSAPGGSSSVEATAVFLDVIGSTRTAERLGDAAFEQALTEMFEIAVGLVESADGTVVKFMGDGFLALFISQSRDDPRAHAASACAAVIGIAEALDRAAREHEEALAVRIGAQSGRVRVGLIGPQRRGSVDAVGDAVNVAARLIGVGKALYPKARNIIMIGEKTAQLSGLDAEALEDCGLITPEGREEQIRVFRLLR